MDNFDDMPESTDWCVGGCQSFKSSAKGKKLYTTLKRRMEKHTNGKHIN